MATARGTRRQRVGGGGSVGVGAGNPCKHLDAQGVATVARAAGFTDDVKSSNGIGSLTMAIAISRAEDGSGDPCNFNGSCCYGLWQVYQNQHPTYSVSCLKSAVCNARAAYAISGHGHNWDAWSTYHSGAYKNYLGVAKAAAGRVQTYKCGQNIAPMPASLKGKCQQYDSTSTNCTACLQKICDALPDGPQKIDCNNAVKAAATSTPNPGPITHGPPDTCSGITGGISCAFTDIVNFFRTIFSIRGLEILLGVIMLALGVIMLWKETTLAGATKAITHAFT